MSSKQSLKNVQLNQFRNNQEIHTYHHNDEKIMLQTNFSKKNREKKKQEQIGDMLT